MTSSFSPPQNEVRTTDNSHGRNADVTAAIAAAKLCNEHHVKANAALSLPICDPDLTPICLPSLANAVTRASSLPSIQSHTSPPQTAPGLDSPSDANNTTFATEHQQQGTMRNDNISTLQTTHPTLKFSHETSLSSLKPIAPTRSSKTGVFAKAFGNTSASTSAVVSPVLSAMGDVTPLPSPLLSSDSPGPWKRLTRTCLQSASPASPSILASDSVLVAGSGQSIALTMESQSRRKVYTGLGSASSTPTPQDAHDGKNETNKIGMQSQNRSISEYVPDPLNIPKRMITVSGSHTRNGDMTHDGQMRREVNLSGARGLTPMETPPSPPPSDSSLSAIDGAPSAPSKQPQSECFEAHGRHDGKRRRWRAIKVLGQGTFSRVMLATSQISTVGPEDGGSPDEPQTFHERRTLVAVKVCEHGPCGGASEDRVEMSLKRELEIMQSIHHPCLVHLKAWNIEPTRAILVLSYCPGGDLFDVASSQRHLLRPALLRRMFAEVVGAVQYLHERRIVHRDIKLENVLVNLTPIELASNTTDWATYPYSVTTLADLGLSRRIADDEKLETRCGSDDYAAPEVIMGQPYDGRATDAWSLGVLLYALLESRLPFDPLPGDPRMRSRTSHRIARVEWRWIEYGPQEGSAVEGEGDHEADLGRFEAKGLLGAMDVVEGLLKRARSRWPLGKVAETEWVRGAITVVGGLCFREEEEGEEVP